MSASPSGSTIGGILGSFVTFDTDGLSFVLTALFVVILLEQLLKKSDHTSAWIGGICSILCLVIFGADSFMLPALIAITCVLLVRQAMAQQRVAHKSAILRHPQKNNSEGVSNDEEIKKDGCLNESY